MSSSSSVLGVEPLGIQPEDAHALELEGDAAGLGEVAAPLVEVGAEVRDGARGVVGRGLDDHGDAVRRVAFVEHLFVGDGVLAGGALDRVLDLVLRHVDGARVLDRALQRRVRVRARARRP